MKLFSFLLSLCLISIFSFPAYSQNINDYVSVTNPADWVEKHDVPVADFALGKDQETHYLLVDQQDRYSASHTDNYIHYATKLLSPNSVENNSTINIEFDPAYHTIKIHHVSLIRGSKVKDILDLSEFSIYRLETDRDKLIYNGTLQISYVAPDVRVGDIIDYSYTRSGKNPAIGPHFNTSFQHRFGVPVQRLSQRLILPADSKVNVRSIANATAPDKTNAGSYDAYSWDTENVHKLVVDEKTPNGYKSYPTTQFSSFENWSDVGRHFAQHYEVPKTLSAPVEKVADDIRSKSDDPSIQLREALDFVQREIRYLGIELGAGGYIPRSPEKVLARRFGDCKDMTHLLITILSAMDIEASPLLVSLDTRGRIESSVASYGVFDHVIVAAALNGKQYFLDPTRGQQLGDLSNLQQGYFEKGVIISSDSPGMIDANAPAPDYWKDIVDTYDVISDPETVTMTSVTTYTMGQADSMLSSYKSNGHDAFEKSFLEYYQNLFPTIEQTDPLEFETSEGLGKVTITVKYKIPNAWEEGDSPNINDFTTRAEDLRNEFPDFVGAKRKSPYAITHPTRTKHTLKFILDDTWDMSDDEEQYSFNAFDFSETSKFENDIYTKTFSYKTKADHIAPEVFRETMSAIQAINDAFWISLTITDEEPSIWDNLDDADDETFGLILIGILALVPFIVAIRRRNFDEAWRDEQIFHPVAMKKFITLSIVTLGLYQIYWIFKNWLWLRNVEQENVSPIWRTIFAAFMNITLFQRIKNSEQRGHSWFKYAAVPLALLYFIGRILDRISFRWEAAPLWFDILAFATVLILVPVVLQINKMNEGREDIIAKNSKFDWPVIGMIAIFAPLFILVIYGFMTGY